MACMRSADLFGFVFFNGNTLDAKQTFMLPHIKMLHKRLFSSSLFFTDGIKDLRQMR